VRSPRGGAGAGEETRFSKKVSQSKDSKLPDKIGTVSQGVLNFFSQEKDLLSKVGNRPAGEGEGREGRAYLSHKKEYITWKRRRKEESVATRGKGEKNPVKGGTGIREKGGRTSVFGRRQD